MAPLFVYLGKKYGFVYRLSTKFISGRQATVCFQVY